MSRWDQPSPRGTQGAERRAGSLATVSVSLGLGSAVLCGEVEELKNCVARVRKSEPGAIQRKGIKWLLFKNQSSHTTEMVGDSSEMSYIVHEDNKRKKVRSDTLCGRKTALQGKNKTRITKIQGIQVRHTQSPLLCPRANCLNSP